MAKPKTPDSPQPEPDPARKPMVAQLRGSQEWKTWIEGLAESEGLPVATLIDRAVRSYAKQVGYEPVPPKR